MKAPTYFTIMAGGLVEIGQLDTKHVHRDWWEEVYPEIDYGGKWLNTYYDIIEDYLIELCRRTARRPVRSRTAP